MLTLVQKGFYFVPSLPFFAIGLSVFISPIILYLTKQINLQSKKYRAFIISSILLFSAIITFTLLQIGKTSRNRELIHDVYLIGSVVPRQSTISVPEKIWNNWDLQCYLIRYFNISLETDYKNQFCIIERTAQIDTPKEFKKIEINTLQYDLYRRP